MHLGELLSPEGKPYGEETKKIAMRNAPLKDKYLLRAQGCREGGGGGIFPGFIFGVAIFTPWLSSPNAVNWTLWGLLGRWGAPPPLSACSPPTALMFPRCF